MKRNLWLLTAAVSAAVMALIVCFSGQPSGESHSLSRGIVDYILALTPNAFPNMTLDEANYFLRKLAHFALYFVLGCSLTGVFSRQKKIPPVLAAILASACFAALDEFHQVFSDGRNADVKDVLLDTWGAAAGSVLCRGMAALVHRAKKRNGTTD